MTRRPSMPGELQRRLLYESQYVCCVCQRSGCQIHHIDGNNANNSEKNLVVLCHTHHDEAHTRRQLSKNLDARALRDAKLRWLSEVKNRRAEVATVSGQKVRFADEWLSTGVAWGYINHKRVAQLVDASVLSGKDESLFRACVSRGLVDERGIIVTPAGVKQSTSYISSSIYDSFEFGDDQRVHALYTAMVDHIGRTQGVVHLERESWTKARLRALVRPGMLVFLERAFYFKREAVTRSNEHRRCVYFKNGIRMEFFVDTVDMFGTTSMTVSFVGHQNAAALVQIKSITSAEDGELILHCTPIALGVGFQSLSVTAHE